MKRYLSNAIHKLEQHLGAMPSLAADDGHQHVPVTPPPRREELTWSSTCSAACAT